MQWIVNDLLSLYLQVNRGSEVQKVTKLHNMKWSISSVGLLLRNYSWIFAADESSGVRQTPRKITAMIG